MSPIGGVPQEPRSDATSTVHHVSNQSLLADLNGGALNRERLLALSNFLKDGSTEFGSSVRGRSMGRALPDGSQIHVRFISQGDLTIGQVVAYVAADRMVVHRLVRFAKWRDKHYVITRGDATVCCDLPVLASSVIGVVTERCATGVWKPVGAPQLRSFSLRSTASALSAVVGGLVRLNPRIADCVARCIIRSHKLVMRFHGFVMR